MLRDSWKDLLAQRCSTTGNQHGPVKGAERRSPPRQLRGRAGTQRNSPGRAQLGLSEISLFPPFCLQAGRCDPEEAVSPSHPVLHQFSTNSNIKMGKESGGRSEEYEATLWLKFAPKSEFLPSAIRVVPRAELQFFGLSLCLRLGENHEIVFGLKSLETLSKVCG